MSARHALTYIPPSPPPSFFCSVADDMVRQFTEGPCILDGELLVWNKKR